MPRFAAIDVGTNSVLLLVAERSAQGPFTAVLERAEITRLGRGVDQTKALAPEAIAETTAAIERFVAEARALHADGIAISATSAARDASNGQVFLDGVRARTGVSVDIISGDEEAKLSFGSAFADFGGAGPLVVLDIGGGSTEFIFGDEQGRIGFRHSFEVGSVRLTERFLRRDPPSEAELGDLRALLDQTLRSLPKAPAAARVIGVAGTVTTLFSVARSLETYDATRVHGQSLTLDEVRTTVGRLAALPVHLRRSVPGLQPRRADVIVAGGLILQRGLELLGATALTVSDRGLRWGLLVDRFGARS
jgi:exopolyphosphatase/guanosine-5'-triphosphate,3'-diphosphate pyrophosphatase